MSRTYEEEAAFIEKVNGHSYRCAQGGGKGRVERGRKGDDASGSH
jgi:hypothetical protein